METWNSDRRAVLIKPAGRLKVNGLLPNALIFSLKNGARGRIINYKKKASELIQYRRQHYKFWNQTDVHTFYETGDSI